jgi:hypothetical protein
MRVTISLVTVIWLPLLLVPTLFTRLEVSRLTVVVSGLVMVIWVMVAALELPVVISIWPTG